MNHDHVMVNSTLVNLFPTAVQAATVNGTGVDVTELDGMGIAILDVAAGGTSTNDTKLQDSADNSIYADMSPAVSFTQVTTGASQQKVPVNLSKARKFVRGVATQGGSHTFSLNLVGLKQYT